MTEVLPPASGNVQGAKDSGGELWVRISAFLSLKSENTAKTYIGVINEWCGFLGAEPGSPEAASAVISATDLHAAAYINWLRSRPGQSPRYSSSKSNNRASTPVLRQDARPRRSDGTQSTLTNRTIVKKTAILRRIYRMLIAADLGVKINPFDTDRITLPRPGSGQKRPTEMVDMEKVSEIISIPDLSTPKGIRDKAILSVLFGGGLRRSEVSALKIGDVRETKNGTLFLRLRATKSGKDFDQALPKWAAEAVLELLQCRKDSGAASGDALFTSFRGPKGMTETTFPVSTSGIYKLFKKYCLLAGAGRYLSPHSARATSITRLLDKGLSHREVREFSRHASVQMVEVYDKRRADVDKSPAKDLDY